MSIVLIYSTRSRSWGMINYNRLLSHPTLMIVGPKAHLPIITVFFFFYKYVPIITNLLLRHHSNTYHRCPYEKENVISYLAKKGRNVIFVLKSVIGVKITIFYAKIALTYKYRHLLVRIHIFKPPKQLRNDT